MVERVAVAISDVTASPAACYHISEPGGGMGMARKFLICLHAEAICVWFSRDMIT